MEKFAVDLDKVLDEFEFNEDRAEQMVAVNVKGCTSSTELGDVSRQLSANQYCRQAYRAQQSTETASLNCINNESGSSGMLPPRTDIPSSGSSSFIKNGIGHPQNIYWQQDVVIQNNINNTSHNKLNVSGVFSSLNEYLNAGNANINVGLKNEDAALIDRTHNSETVINKSAIVKEHAESFSRNLEIKKLSNHAGSPKAKCEEVSTFEMQIDNPDEQIIHSEDILKQEDFSNSSLPANESLSDTLYDLPKNSTNSSVSYESELYVNIKVDDFEKNSNLCSNDTEVAHLTSTNTDATSVQKDAQHTEQNDIREIKDYDASFDITGSEDVKSITDIQSCKIQGSLNRKDTFDKCPAEEIKNGNIVKLDAVSNEPVSNNIHVLEGTEPFNERTSSASTELNSVCKPVSFNAVDDYSKEELEKYLEELCNNDQKIYTCDQTQFNGDLDNIYKEENSNELKPKIIPDTEINDILQNDQIKSVINLDDDDDDINRVTSDSRKECSSSSDFSCTEKDTRQDDVVERLRNQINFKTDLHDTNVNNKNVANLCVVSPSVKSTEITDEDMKNNLIEEGDGSLNATISISMLNTSKSTANVTNVISIECQQTKKCILNEKKEDLICVHPTIETNNQTLVSDCEKSANNGVSYSECKTTQLTDLSGDAICSSLDGKVPLLHPNSSLQGEKQVINNSSEKAVTKDNNNANTVIGESLVQMTKEGGRINVLGEEERPSRPKFLLLPSKIMVESQLEIAENDNTLRQHAALGLPGETPVAPSVLPEEIQKDNSLPSVSKTSGNSMLTSPDVSDSSSLEVALSPVPSVQTNSPSTNESASYVLSPEERNLGKLPPFWVPDSDAPNCMLCDQKFTVLKRRHHCRACGKVLCSKCCSLKSRLEYMENAEARVCHLCFDILARVVLTEQGESASESPNPVSSDAGITPLGRQPNPNNPMEYCSTIPPLEQAASTSPQPVPSVLVPVGVLKREGCGRAKGDVTKQVMFSDGIRPGGDLTELDGSSEPRLPYRRQERILKRVGTPPGVPPNTSHHSGLRSLLSLEPKTKSYIPSKGLPPLVLLVKGELKFEEVTDMEKLFAQLKAETEPAPMFALNRNLFVQIKILNLDCCVNRLCWSFSTNGMSSVGQDEIVIVLEYLPEDTTIPKDIFLHLNTIYQDASRGNMVSEMGHSVFQGPTFLGSSEHGGFIYIRPSFQCLHKLILPAPPYLVAVLFHRWEIPWAKVFPIRLMLRLGAEFRYYPCMLVSVRQRKPVFCEIGHTIINLLADFRNLSYTLPSVRGLVIHMEDRHTSILLPKNRYDQVARALNNSNDHVLALAANFSMSADSHLVCIQSHEDESYHTQAINIHNKPRKVTGASFVVFNGALKMSSNLSAKSSIVEDGLMVQITPDTIQELRSALRKMQDFSVRCGPANAVLPDETVNIKWVQDDRNFNIGVVSFIDGFALDGVPSIRVHNGTDYMGTVRFIRWTEVFILQSGENSERNGDPLDISRLSESLARATCLALVNYIDLLAQAGLTKIAVRANIHPENVGYEAGSRGEKLPPIYMKSLDNELVPVLHKAASMAPESPPVLLELIFHVMLQ